MKTTLPLALLFAAVLGGGVWLAQSSTATPPSSSAASSTTTYTATQVAAHASFSSCWTIINGNVYDLTSFIGAHPGGEGAILSLCGRDGTQAFEAQHGSQGRPNQILATLQIGTLAP